MRNPTLLIAALAALPALSSAQIPAKPIGLTAVPGDAKASLSWYAVSGAQGYVVSRAASASGPFATVATVRAAWLVNNGLTNGTKYYYKVAARNASGTSATTAAVAVSPYSPLGKIKPFIGMNADGVTDYGFSAQFADLIETARGFGQYGNAQGDQQARVPVDARGWPLTDTSVYVYAGRPNATHQNGLHRLSFQGRATIRVDAYGPSAVLQNQAYDAASNTTTADVLVSGIDGNPANSSVLVLNLRDTRRTAAGATNTGVTDIKLLRPGYAVGDLFSTSFLTLMSQGSTVRFMDWTATNSNAAVEWTERPYPGRHVSDTTGYGWQGKGAPWEYAVQLCNTTGTDLWLCVPYKASDDYVRKLADLVKNGSTVDGKRWPGLNPNLKVYVELSNETWNYGGAFQQSHQELMDAQDMANAGDPRHYNYDVNNNPGYWRIRRHADRTRELSLIFRQAFGDAQMMTRVRPLLQGQKAWASTTAVGLLYLDDVWNNRKGAFTADPHPVNYFLWGGGGSGYVESIPDGYFNAQGELGVSLDTLFNNAYPESWAGFDAMIQREIDFLQSYGLKRVAYEAGPGLDQYLHSDRSFYDPRMRAVTQGQIERFFRTGGAMWMHFNSAGNYTHGLLLDGWAGGSHRLDGFAAAAAAAKPAVTYAPAVPAVIDAGLWRINDSDWSGPSTTPGPVTLRGTDLYAYSFHTDAAGNLGVRLDGSGGSVLVKVDGNPIGTIALPGSTSLPVSLDPGVHSVRIEAASGTPTVSKIRVGQASSDLSAAAGVLNVKLDWTAVSGATAYSLYRGTTPDIPTATPYKTGLTGTAYTDTAVTNGATYYYKLRATVNGALTAPSNEAYATVTDGLTNLVREPGYEDGGGQWFGGGTYGIVTDGPHGGAKAMAITGGWASVFQTEGGLKPSTTYTLKVWAKAGATGTGGLTVYAKSPTGATTNAAVTATGYTLVTLTFTTDADQTSFEIGAAKLDGGTRSLTVDDWSLTERS